MPGIATYSNGTGTRSGSASIAITDTGGTWTAIGAVVLGGYGFGWTATFYDGFVGGDGGPEGPGGGSPETERRCTLSLTGGTGAGTFDFATEGIDLEGTCSISIPVRHIVRVGVSAYTNIAEGYDLQNGALTASLSLMGYTVSNATNNTTNRIFPVWTLRSRTEATSAGVGNQNVAWTTAPGVCSSATTSVSASGTSVDIGGGGGYYTYSASANTTSGAYASISKSTTGPLSGPMLFAEAVAQDSQDRDAEFHGRLNRLMATWPDPIEWRLYESQGWQADADGSVGAAIAQRQYDHLSTCWDHSGPSFQSQTDREQVNTKELIKPQARYVVGGVTTITSLAIHGPRWDALTIGHTATQTVDNGSTTSPTGDWAGSWSATGGSVASVGGAIEISGSAGKVARRNFTNGLKQTGWQGYSRLRIRLKCSAADHAITVRLGSDTTEAGVTYKAPTWTIQTGAADTYTEHWVDLGADENGPDLAIEGSGVTFGTGSFRGAYNPRAALDLYLTGLGAGVYSVDSVTLSNESDGAGGYHSPAFHLAPSQGSNLPAIFGIVDGSEVYRASLPPTQSIADTISYANTDTTLYRFGYTLTDLEPFSSPVSEPWPSSDLTSSFHDFRFIGGGGILWNGSTQTWSIPFDSGAVGSTIPAQWLVGSVQWDWPSDLLGFVTDGHIGGGTWAGHSIWGRVLSTGDSGYPEGKDGLEDETVTMSTTDDTTLATTTTDSDGWFSFPAVASPGNQVRFTALGRTVLVQLGWFRTRVVITPAPTVSANFVGMAISATRRICRGIKNGSGVLTLEWWRLPASWEPTVTPLTLTGGGCLAFDQAGIEQRLWLAYEDGGGIKTRRTEDEGSTWSVVTTITGSGTNPALVISPTSVRHYFWVDGSAIKTKILDSQDGTLTGTTTVVASGVASSTIDAVHAGEEIFLTYQSTAGAVVSVRSTDGGLTFS